MWFFGGFFADFILLLPKTCSILAVLPDFYYWWEIAAPYPVGAANGKK